MWRWVNVVLAGAYVVLSCAMLIVLLVVLGFRLSNGLRWLLLVGWLVSCFGWVRIKEKFLTLLRPGCRLPILPEEERLGEAMRDVLTRAGCERRVRFLIDGNPEGGVGAVGYGTILIHSGSLQLASEDELRGLLAHALGQLQDWVPIADEVLGNAGAAGLVFHGGRRMARRLWRVVWPVGMLLAAALVVVGILLLPFLAVDLVFRGVRWLVREVMTRRQDRFVFSIGYGEGLRLWLQQQGLGRNAGRIRRLERMAGLRD